MPQPFAFEISQPRPATALGRRVVLTAVAAGLLLPVSAAAAQAAPKGRRHHHRHHHRHAVADGGTPARAATADAASDPSATVTAVAAALTGADWTSHFGSREAFEKDWWPCFSWALGGVEDPSGSSWTAGTGNSFYPFAFVTDPTAPAGEYVRVFCDRLSRHPADVGRTGGLEWIGSEATTRRGWTSGYVEFCARFPAAGSGVGGWPALWLYAQQSHLSSGTDGTGPFRPVDATAQAAELDPLEVFGTSVVQWTTTVHAGSPGSSSASNHPLHTSTTDRDWHTWGCYRDPTGTVADFYFDRVAYASATPAEAVAFRGQEMCARLDHTVSGPGSSWMPTPTASTPDSLYMDVSYVRHYPGVPPVGA